MPYAWCPPMDLNVPSPGTSAPIPQPLICSPPALRSGSPAPLVRRSDVEAVESLRVRAIVGALWLRRDGL